MPLPSAILPRLGQLVRMLGSDQDHEALGAVRALRRTLNKAGVDLHALADAVEHPPAPVITRETPTASRRSRKARSPSPGSVELQLARRDQVIEGLDKAIARNMLSAWEANFGASVITILQGPRPRLSARQYEIVERLLSKCGED